MDKKKLALILLLVIFCVFAVTLFRINKNRDSLNKSQPAGLLMEKLVQTKNDSGVFNKELFGKIKNIGKNALDVADDSSPIKKIADGGASPTVSLKTTDITKVFFVENGKLQENKRMADLHLGDVVRVVYNNLTKEISVVYVSVNGADVSSGIVQNIPPVK